MFTFVGRKRNYCTYSIKERIFTVSNREKREICFVIFYYWVNLGVSQKLKNIEITKEIIL